jgi:hypothetical protein
MEVYEDCQHQINNGGTCSKCGIIFESAYDITGENIKNCSKFYQSRNSVLDNLKGYPDEVILKARQNILRIEAETGKKVRNDRKNTFIQIYTAYIDCGYNFDIKKIAKDLNLDRKAVNLCKKKLTGTSLVLNHYHDNTYAAIVIISPVSYINEICVYNKLEEYIEEITEKTKNILKKKDILLSFRPNYIAYGIIKLFCEKNNIAIKNLTKNTDISDNALKKNILEIEEFFSK